MTWYTVELEINSTKKPPTNELRFLDWIINGDFYVGAVTITPRPDSVPNPLSTSEADPKEELPDDHPPS